MEYEISPEPADAERAAILAALEAEENDERGRSRRADALLPSRLPEGDEP